ncbi:unnamed protein product [Amoebophrya sp. A120]|nr:unnamed protein product [Amoebophrya sp. A120]|eukprot:GSA120T00019893001.1
MSDGTQQQQQQQNNSDTAVTDFLRNLFSHSNLQHDDSITENLDPMLGLHFDFVCDKVADKDKTDDGDDVETLNPHNNFEVRTERTNSEDVKTEPGGVMSSGAAAGALLSESDANSQYKMVISQNEESGNSSSSTARNYNTTRSGINANSTTRNNKSTRGRVSNHSEEFQGQVSKALEELAQENVIAYDPTSKRIALKVELRRDTLLLHDIPLRTSKNVLAGLFEEIGFTIVSKDSLSRMIANQAGVGGGGGTASRSTKINKQAVEPGSTSSAGGRASSSSAEVEAGDTANGGNVEGKSKSTKNNQATTSTSGTKDDTGKASSTAVAPTLAFWGGTHNTLNRTRVWYVRFYNPEDAISAALQLRNRTCPWDDSKKIRANMRSHHVVQSFHQVQQTYFSPLFPANGLSISGQASGGTSTATEEVLSSLTPLTLATLEQNGNRNRTTNVGGNSPATSPSAHNRGNKNLNLNGLLDGEPASGAGKMMVPELRDSVREILPQTLPSLDILGDRSYTADVVNTAQSPTAENQANVVMGLSTSLKKTNNINLQQSPTSTSQRDRLFTNNLDATSDQLSNSNLNYSNIQDGILNTSNAYNVVPNYQPQYSNGGFIMPDGSWVPANSQTAGTWVPPYDEPMLNDPNYLMQRYSFDAQSPGAMFSGGDNMGGAAGQSPGGMDGQEYGTMDEAGNTSTPMMYDPNTGLVMWSPDGGQKWYPQTSVGLDEQGNFFLPTDAQQAQMHQQGTGFNMQEQQAPTGGAGMYDAFNTGFNNYGTATASSGAKMSTSNWTNSKGGPGGANFFAGGSSSAKGGAGGKYGYNPPVRPLTGEIEQDAIAPELAGFTHEFRRYRKEDLFSIINNMVSTAQSLPTNSDDQKTEVPKSGQETINTPSAASSKPRQSGTKEVLVKEDILFRPHALADPKFNDVVREKPNWGFFVNGEDLFSSDNKADNKARNYRNNYNPTNSTSKGAGKMNSSSKGGDKNSKASYSKMTDKTSTTADQNDEDVLDEDRGKGAGPGRKRGKSKKKKGKGKDGDTTDEIAPATNNKEDATKEQSGKQDNEGGSTSATTAAGGKAKTTSKAGTTGKGGKDKEGKKKGKGKHDKSNYPFGKTRTGPRYKVTSSKIVGGNVNEPSTTSADGGGEPGANAPAPGSSS